MRWSTSNHPDFSAVTIATPQRTEVKGCTQRGHPHHSYLSAKFNHPRYRIPWFWDIQAIQCAIAAPPESHYSHKLDGHAGSTATLDVDPTIAPAAFPGVIHIERILHARSDVNSATFHS